MSQAVTSVPRPEREVKGEPAAALHVDQGLLAPLECECVRVACFEKFPTQKKVQETGKIQFPRKFLVDDKCFWHML